MATVFPAKRLAIHTLLVAAVAACAAASRGPSPASAPVRPPLHRDVSLPAPAPDRDAAPCAYDPSADEALLLRVARESADAADRERLFAAVTQSAPSGFRPLHGRSTPFPGRYAKVVGYAYRFAEPSPEMTAKGCTLEAVASDGTLCPSVVRSGVELTAAQAARIFRALTQPSPSVKALSRCAFDPHHAFVFYGDSGAPIAQALICFACDEASTAPAVPGRGTILTGDERRELHSVCRELDLPDCREPEEGEGNPTRAALDRRVAAGLSRWPWVPAPLRADLRLTELSPDQKRRVCAAFERNASTSKRLRPGAGFECSGGSAFGVLDAAECSHHFPSCEASVGAVDACLARLDGDPCQQEKATAAACAPVDGCVWGVARHHEASSP